MTTPEDQKQERTGTYDNRGRPLPNLRLARQRLGFTQCELASRPGMG